MEYEPVVKELATVRDYVRWGTSSLERAGVCCGHGMDRPLDEAAYLVAHALALAPSLPDAFLDAALTAEERRRVVALVEERVRTRKPAAYLTGEAWFAGLRLRVDERVLVPRSPIAELIEGGFEPWLESASPRVLDLCTGSGCIALACAVHLDAQVDAVDLSADALALAAENVADHGLQDRVELIRSDLFASLASRRYDLIVCNPPYVGAAELAELPREYQWEPRLALASGPDGLDLPLRVLAGAARHLAPTGFLVLEVGASAAALQAVLPDMACEWVSFEHGGDGVLVIEYDGLEAIQPRLESCLAQRSRSAHGE